MILQLLKRDLRNLGPGGRGGGSTLPILFFLAVAILVPFAIGPDRAMLARTGGGVIWIAALLASLLPLERLVDRDVEKGFFDQFSVRGISEEVVMAVRLLAHWLSFAPLLLVACLPAAALLDLDRSQLLIVLLGLVAGTPGLAAVGLMIAALTSGLRGNAALTGVLALPLSLPVMIFGAGSLARNDFSGIAIAGAVSLVLCALAPFLSAAALRTARNG
ncbi:heme ABC transporter permease CcmB [Altererythrobacter aurantiacus]|uniref:Heme exporter protein B n=1 Tax=Parapontixanthobacter aurantiacus TaxID=1463599 RepID=A0A844ZC18_9SPHN|nr:heme exporter protein CcmB [Parapontixanthobacter aurantiacus]MXO84683.1 heme ABC transporter permease CcmB [Parapontixanthobacter aurantiacus]